MKNSDSMNIPTHKPRPMIDLLVSIVIPSFILMKLSGDSDLGATNALIVALAFPLGWGLFELVKYRKVNFIAILGLVSVLLTGGIGLLELDLKWLAIKEAAIPAIIGLVVLGSTFTRYPLIKTLLYNPVVLNIEKIEQKLIESDNIAKFEKRLSNATYFLAGTFGFSAVMNYLLAKWVVTSPTGSAAFNEELGQMTLLSYPVIAIPSMLMMMAIFYYLWRTIHGMTGLPLEEIMVSSQQKK
ncbi:VC0807 family protein [Thiomicrorhabdus lithotrophica]|uniref:MFS transporter n=1 Tax=Thiomicrorhabdus lithotrophica TaxID=2949997 RepID=A0ABY8CDT3_9GAMM|nr:VC0807 family protein [Thiomicrorhabdus lithotrophica]WEJ63657.1 MFS transporter [Thiomicrorhabdus lithotrophica]